MQPGMKPSTPPASRPASVKPNANLCGASLLPRARAKRAMNIAMDGLLKDAGVAVSAAGTKFVRTTATAKRPCAMVPSQAAGEKRQAAGQASVKSVCDAPAIGGCDHEHGAKHSTQLLRCRYMTRELL